MILSGRHADYETLTALRRARQHCLNCARAASAMAEQMQDRPGFGTKSAAACRRIAGEASTAYSLINASLEHLGYDPENPHA